MQDATAIQGIEDRYAALVSLMDERTRRQWAAAEARSYDWGGVRAVSRVTGMSPNTIKKGLTELEAREADPEAPIGSRPRQAGAGRKRATEADPQLTAALEQLVDPTTRGDPMSPLRWTCKSTAQLPRELTRQGHPVISVDTKKKELVGNFRNSGREWQLRGEPDEALVHDFMDKELGKAIPYGVYDVTENQGWVSVGIDHDTGRFATSRRTGVAVRWSVTK